MQSRTVEELARCTRVLALNIGYFQTNYGALPKDEMIALLLTDAIDAEQARMLEEGMQALIGVLGAAAQGGRDPRGRERFRHRIAALIPVRPARAPGASTKGGADSA